VYLSLSATAQARVLDKVGWKNQPAGGFEQAVENSEINSSNVSISRKFVAGVSQDTDNNSSDFNAPSGTLPPLGMSDPPQP